MPDPFEPMRPQNSPGLRANSISSRISRPASDTGLADLQDFVFERKGVGRHFCNDRVDVLSATALVSASTSACIHD